MISKGYFKNPGDDMLKILPDESVSVDNESGEVLAHRMLLPVSRNPPWKLNGYQQFFSGCGQDCCYKYQDSKRTTEMKIVNFHLNSEPSVFQYDHENSLNKIRSVEIVTSFKNSVNISVFREFLLGDKVFDESFEEVEFQKMMRSKKFRQGSFKRGIKESKFVQFFKHHPLARIIMCLIWLMMIYTLFFIIPKCFPFAICIFFLFQFICYQHLHNKIHEHADMLGITPMFTGTIFGNLMIFVVRKTCTTCNENHRTDAVFKYYKSMSNDDNKKECSSPEPVNPVGNFHLGDKFPEPVNPIGVYHFGEKTRNSGENQEKGDSELITYKITIQILVKIVLLVQWYNAINYMYKDG